MLSRGLAPNFSWMSTLNKSSQELSCKLSALVGCILVLHFFKSSDCLNAVTCLVKVWTSIEHLSHKLTAEHCKCLIDDSPLAYLGMIFPSRSSQPSLLMWLCMAH